MVADSQTKHRLRSHVGESVARASANMNAKNMPNDRLTASAVVVSSEKSHHFCRVASSRSITFSAVDGMFFSHVDPVPKISPQHEHETLPDAIIVDRRRNLHHARLNLDDFRSQLLRRMMPSHGNNFYGVFRARKITRLCDFF